MLKVGAKCLFSKINKSTQLSFKKNKKRACRKSCDHPAGWTDFENDAPTAPMRFETDVFSLWVNFSTDSRRGHFE